MIGLIGISKKYDDVRYIIDIMSSLYPDNMICKLIQGSFFRMFLVSLTNECLIKKCNDQTNQFIFLSAWPIPTIYMYINITISYNKIAIP